MLHHKRIVFLIVLTLLLLLIPQAAAAQSPSTYAALRFTGVTSGTSAIGSDFTTDVEISIITNGPPLAGIEAFLGFSSSTIEPVDANTSTAGVQPATMMGSGFIMAANEVITAPDTIAPGLNVPGRTCPGTYPCVHIILALQQPKTNETTVIARLHWRGKVAGGTGFTLLNPVLAGVATPTPPRSAFSDADGYLIPLNVAAAADFNVLNPGRIGGIVLRQGVPPTVPNTGTQGCTQIDAVVPDPFSSIPAFTLINSTTIPTWPPQVNSAGGFMLIVNSGAGTYTVRASYPGYLQAHKSGVYVSGSDVLIGTTKLYGGDVNSDGRIDILDIVTIIGNIGLTGPIRSSTTNCSALAGTQPNPPASLPPDLATDINDDGMVDISDLAIAAGNFGKVGPTTWAP